MKFKLALAALALALAVPATAQTNDTTPAGCEGAAAGTVLSDGTVCPAAGPGVLGSGTLGSNIVPLSGASGDSDDDNEATDPENGATPVEGSDTEHDSVDDSQDTSSQSDSGEDN